METEMDSNMLTLEHRVAIEAGNLRTFASSSELDRLDFDTLDSTRADLCIYGQMTGSCFCDRAAVLIMQSCEKVYVCKTCDVRGGDVRGGGLVSPSQYYRTAYWSPIEIFIDLPENKANGNNGRLVAFLKGATDELELV